MRRWTLSAAIGAAILSSSSGTASQVQVVASGIYVLDEERSDNAFQEIDSATADLSITQRPLVRIRLRKSVAVNRIRISMAGRLLGIGYDAKAPILVRIGEDPVRWQLIEELVFAVSAKADSESVSVTFRGDDSDRTVTYRSMGQDLVEDTNITSPLLSTPIVYTRVYSRTN